MKIILKGNPISINSLYRGRRFLTDKGKDLKQDYFYQIKKQYRGELLKGDLAVKIDAYFGSHRERDLDNAVKACQDALTGTVIEDDSLINELHIYRHYSKEDPRVEIEIYGK